MKYPSLESLLADLKQSGAYRETRVIEPVGYRCNSNQQQLANFSSNDYLGLASDTQLQANFFQQADLTSDSWMTSSSSRSLTGTTPAHVQLEAHIARSYNKSGALIFNSGYHANSGILPALTDKQDLILADKLVHASVLDGLRLGQADFKRFAHNNIEHLEQLLRKYRSQYRNVWLVSESIFSMDGDRTPLQKLVQLKSEYQAFIYLDEAHAVGCTGERGLGLASELGVLDQIDLLVGTFGKALAGYGGFAVGDKILIDTMTNRSRSWLFSTALPPINIEWNNYIWQRLADFAPQRESLAALSNQFKQGLSALDIDYLGDSNIVPVIRAGNSEVLALAKRLEQAGILALPIRSPTVAKGSERIRFSITANLPERIIERCLSALNE